MNSGEALQSGFLLSLGLIASIGPQNAYVLRQATLGEGRAIVFAICFATDLVLISLGVLGLGSAIAASPVLLNSFSLLGIVFLFWHAARSFRQFTKTFSDDPSLLTTKSLCPTRYFINLGKRRRRLGGGPFCLWYRSSIGFANLVYFADINWFTLRYVLSIKDRPTLFARYDMFLRVECRGKTSNSLLLGDKNRLDRCSVEKKLA